MSRFFLRLPTVEPPSGSPMGCSTIAAPGAKMGQFPQDSAPRSGRPAVTRTIAPRKPLNMSSLPFATIVAGKPVTGHGICVGVAARLNVFPRRPISDRKQGCRVITSGDRLTTGGPGDGDTQEKAGFQRAAEKDILAPLQPAEFAVGETG